MGAIAQRTLRTNPRVARIAALETQMDRNTDDPTCGFMDDPGTANFGRTVRDYTKYRFGYPDELFDRLSSIGIGVEGQHILDVGTGTGYLARGFARRGGLVVGLDRSAPLLAAASELDREAAVSIEYLLARAESIPTPANTFDTVTAGQCWHWFDRGRAAAEAYRVLRPGGRLLITHFDWVPLPNNIVDRTERLILAFNPDWQGGGGTGMYPAWLADVADQGFEAIETFSFDRAITYTHRDWRGRIRASAGIGGSLPATRVEAFDRALDRLLAEEFEDPLEVPHRSFSLHCRKPG